MFPSGLASNEPANQGARRLFRTSGARRRPPVEVGRADLDCIEEAIPGDCGELPGMEHENVEEIEDTDRHHQRTAQHAHVALLPNIPARLLGDAILAASQSDRLHKGEERDRRCLDEDGRGDKRGWRAIRAGAGSSTIFMVSPSLRRGI